MFKSQVGTIHNHIMQNLTGEQETRYEYAIFSSPLLHRNRCIPWPVLWLSHISPFILDAPTRVCLKAYIRYIYTFTCSRVTSFKKIEPEQQQKRKHKQNSNQKKKRMRYGRVRQRNTTLVQSMLCMLCISSHYQTNTLFNRLEEINNDVNFH